MTDQPITDADDLEADLRATGHTPRGYRVPDGNEAPDVPLWIGYLAGDVDTDVGIISGKVTTNGTDITGLKTATADTGSLADGATPDPIASFGTGWTAYAGGPWTNGIRVRRWGPVVQISGAVQKTSFAANDPVLVLSAGFRPDTYLDNGRYTIDTAGSVKILTAGSGAVALFAIFLRA